MRIATPWSYRGSQADLLPVELPSCYFCSCGPTLWSERQVDREPLQPPPKLPLADGSRSASQMKESAHSSKYNRNRRVCTAAIVGGRDSAACFACCGRTPKNFGTLSSFFTSPESQPGTRCTNGDRLC